MTATTPHCDAGPAALEQWNGDNLPAINRIAPEARSTPGRHGPVLHIRASRGGHEAGAGTGRPLALGGWVAAEDGEVKVFPWHELEAACRPCLKGLPGRPPNCPQGRWCGRCRYEAAHGGRPC